MFVVAVLVVLRYFMVLDTLQQIKPNVRTKRIAKSTMILGLVATFGWTLLSNFQVCHYLTLLAGVCLKYLMHNLYVSLHSVFFYFHFLFSFSSFPLKVADVTVKILTLAMSQFLFIVNQIRKLAYYEAKFSPQINQLLVCRLNLSQYSLPTAVPLMYSSTSRYEFCGIIANYSFFFVVIPARRLLTRFSRDETWLLDWGCWWSDDLASNISFFIDNFDQSTSNFAGGYAI